MVIFTSIEKKGGHERLVKTKREASCQKVLESVMIRSMPESSLHNPWLEKGKNSMKLREFAG